MEYDLKSTEKKATREGFGEGMMILGEKNPDVVALAASVGDSAKIYPFKEKYPDRFVEAGIAEQNMIGLAAGLALGGKVPFASSFCAFLPGRCFDQIRQSVCYSNLNVKLVATHAGITVGADGATHQMMEDLAMLRALPGLTMVVPCDAIEARKATLAFAERIGPSYLRLSREKLPVFTNEDSQFKIGKAVTLRDGHDATIIACGVQVYYALRAAEALESEGIEVRVLNMHTIKPLDELAIVSAAEETGAIVTAEEHQINAGLGGAVAEVLGEQAPVPLQRVGMPDSFGESGPASDLLAKYGMDDTGIIDAVRKVLARKD